MAIEREPISALHFWRETIIQGLKKGTPDLTTRQMAILLTTYLTPPPHTERGLAKSLNISKPAVTRALDRLGRLELTNRKQDEADRRNVLVQRTVKGSVYLSEFADVILGAASQERLSKLQKPHQ